MQDPHYSLVTTTYCTSTRCRARSPVITAIKSQTALAGYSRINWDCPAGFDVQLLLRLSVCGAPSAPSLSLFFANPEPATPERLLYPLCLPNRILPLTLTVHRPRRSASFFVPEVAASVAQLRGSPLFCGMQTLDKPVSLLSPIGKRENPKSRAILQWFAVTGGTCLIASTRLFCNSGFGFLCLNLPSPTPTLFGPVKNYPIESGWCVAVCRSRTTTLYSTK